MSALRHAQSAAPIAFLDLNAPYEELKNRIDDAVARVLRSGWYIGGAEVEAFEAAFARYCGVRHCVGVGNGLDALTLALLAMGVGSGDEVIVASNTYIATWLAVSQCGAVPVPVEPRAGTANLDPGRIEAAITPRTRVILPTHLYGQPAEMTAICEIARRRGLRVLEDGAQAHGAAWQGRRIGAHGDAVTWSFYPGKNLGAMGDGGAVTTDDADLAAAIRKLGNYGSSRRYVHEVKGCNSRLDPVQAAILSVKLGMLDEWNGRRRAIAALYDRALAGSRVTIPVVAAGAEPVWHLYVVSLDARDAVAAALKAEGIDTLIHYPTPPHLQGAYRDMALSPGSLPVAERLAATALSLPIGPHLAEADAARVADAVRRAVA